MSDAQNTGVEPAPAPAGKASSYAKQQLLAALTTTDVTIRRLDL
jgi:hypothetical protein